MSSTSVQYILNTIFTHKSFFKGGMEPLSEIVFKVAVNKYFY